MATVTESDLQELRNLISAGFAKSEANQARMESRINDLDNRISRLEEAVQRQKLYLFSQNNGEAIKGDNLTR